MNNNTKLIAEIVIAVLLGTIGAVVIIQQVMSVQDNFDEAGIGFTKMNDGMLLSSSGYSPSPRVTVTEMAHTCADKLREISDAKSSTSSISDCVRTMLKELNK